MNELLISLFGHKTIALLGFGREGLSTYSLLRSVFPEKVLTIIDENEKITTNAVLKKDPNLKFITGKDCMQRIDDFNVAIKSPGIPSNTLPTGLKKVRITSQTDIFLQCFSQQVIGITGTKGKSTTSSLVYHILRDAGIHTLLVGNIGVPPFDCIDDISPDSKIVMELSSHQLEYVNHAPHIAILLNIFQEHLDHYKSYEDYQLAKLNIARYQSADDYFLYNDDNGLLKELIAESPRIQSEKLAFSMEPGHTPLHILGTWIIMQIHGQETRLYDILEGQPLQGHHNLYNIMAGAAACFLSGVSPEQISSGIKSFKGLEHRIEPVGTYDGILWYNDSIATIPEATIEAVKTLLIVDTLILGGFDRGIDYDILYPFLITSGVTNIIFVGQAGARMMDEFEAYGHDNIRFYHTDDYKMVVQTAREVTGKGKICLLSPAAASYDMFKNFEERGCIFKKNVRELNPSQV